jgi:hypothetical protein
MMTIGIALGIRSERYQYDPMDALVPPLAGIIGDEHSPIAAIVYILPKNALCLAVIVSRSGLNSLIDAVLPSVQTIESSVTWNAGARTPGMTCSPSS